MGLFAFVSVIVFIHGIYQQLRGNVGNAIEEPSRILFYAMLCAVAFFALLPAMHERYLFPAVIMALAYAAINPIRLMYALLITMIAFVNMAMINGVNGSDIWLGVSTIMMFALLFALIEFFIGKYFYIFLSDILKCVVQIKWLGVWTFIAVSIILIASLTHHYKKLDVVLTDNQILLTHMARDSATQTHGTLQINRSVDNHTLSIGNQRYENGFGTHTESAILFTLPPGAIEFSFIVGVDDEVGTADMQFSVWGDDKQLWQSKVYYGFESSNHVEHVDIRNVHTLSLRVSPVTDMQFDHADWIDPVITFDRDVKTLDDQKPNQKLPEESK